MSQDIEQDSKKGSKERITFFKWFPFTLTILSWVVFITAVVWLQMFVSDIVENKENAYGPMPTYELLENPKSEYSSVLFSGDSVVLGKYYRSNRTKVEYEELSQNMLNALIATEDARYYEHSGIDMRGSFAILYYLAQGDKRGSSTISQQLAKNLFKTRKFDGKLVQEASGTKKKILKTIFDKSKEWITAVRLERSYTKEEIITMYLNTVDFGSLSFGIQTAAKTFFSKDQANLEINEAAVLTGLLKAPTRYSPVLYPERSLKRRNTVLGQMQKYNYIQNLEYDSLKTLPLNLSYKVEHHADGLAPYFRNICSQYLGWWCRENGYDLWADGLRIYTTLDSRMQTHAEAAVREHLSSYQDLFFEVWNGKNPWSRLDSMGRRRELSGFLTSHIKRTPYYRYLTKTYKNNSKKIENALNKKKKMRVFSWYGDVDTTFSHYDSLKYYKQFLQTGFVSMDPYDGEIKAWVGGINYKHFKYDHVRQGKRQPGSTFKPIVYATILGEIGEQYGPCYQVADSPVTFYTGDPSNPTWTPQNAGGKFSGKKMTLRQAMARSKNSITAYMMKTMGDRTPNMVKKYAEQLGITSPLEAVPAMCLGTFDVSVYEMVGAYSTFVNGGTYTKPRYIDRIEDRYGNVIKQFSRETKSAISKELAHIMTYMLRGATEEKGGTGRGLYRYSLLSEDSHVGAKTGTTQNYSDGWFMGVTPELVSGVWVGCEDRAVHFKTIKNGQGARMAMPIWGKYMEKIYADSTLSYAPKKFDNPSFETKINIDCTLKPEEIDSSLIVPDSLKNGLEDLYKSYDDDSEEEI